jgi:predicted MFS family arabinose efflux permease
MVTAAAVFGVGFGTAYPAYVAHVTRHVAPARRGAAFGGILAAFDTGVGTGSVVSGYVVERFGFSAAYGVAAVLSSLALPYFLLVEKRLLASSSAATAASPPSSDAAR